MTDYTELKRLAEAANAVTGDASVDITISSEPGPNQAEIDAVTAFIGAATPAVVLAMIDEIERLEVEVKRMTSIAYAAHGAFRMETLAERDQLRAEVAGLKTGYEAYERVNAELKVEVEGLRKDAERYRFIEGNPEVQIEYTGELTLSQYLDAAMSKENSHG